MHVVLDRCRGRCVLDRDRHRAGDAHAAAGGGSLVVRRAFGALRAAVFLLRLVATELGLLIGGVVDRLVVGVAVVVTARIVVLLATLHARLGDRFAAGDGARAEGHRAGGRQVAIGAGERVIVDHRDRDRDAHAGVVGLRIAFGAGANLVR